MLLKACALIALVAFAQIVRAQEDDGMEELKESEHKQDDDLAERGGAYGLNRGSWRGDGGLYRGNRFSSNRHGGSRGSLLLGGHGLSFANRVSSKVVPGTVQVAPTVRTHSNSVRVLKSVKHRNFVQNSESTVVQNNVVKATSVHVHTDTVVHKPKTINKIYRRHKTLIKINTQPIKTNINIERKQEIIRPEVKNIVIYQNTESLRRQRLPTIVRNENKYERLPTQREPTQNDGTEVIGNPANAGSVNLAGASGGAGAFSHGLNREYEGGGGFGGNHGSSSYGKKNLYERSNEAKQEDEEAAAAPAAAQEEEAATN